MAGITVVHDGDFIGVTSADPQKLAAAAEAIKAEWKTEQQPGAPGPVHYLKSHPRRQTASRRESATSAIDEASAIPTESRGAPTPSYIAPHPAGTSAQRSPLE